MKNKNIYNLIYLLNHSKAINRIQQRKRDALMARDFQKLKAVEEGGENPIGENPQPKKDILPEFHLPREVSQFLLMFSGDNSLKFTTHVWDPNEVSNYDDFCMQYSKVIKENKLWKKLYSCNSRLYYLLYNYLFYEGSANHWSDEYKITVGLMNPKGILSDWLNANPTKQIFDMPLSMYKNGFMKENKRIEDKIPTYFNDLVEVFKNCIEFRDSKFYYKVKKIFTNSDIELDKAKLKSLKGKTFYTSTELVCQALSNISDNIRRRHEKSSELCIWLDQNTESMDLHILHVGSFSLSDLNNDKLMLRNKGSQMSGIKANLQSLCDFSVLSRFIKNGEEVDARIDYLYTADAHAEPRVTMLEDGSCRGFEYILKFYK